MKKHYLLLVVLAVFALFVSCQKDLEGGITLTLETNDYHHMGGKCYIDSEGYSCWEQGDKVYLSSVTPYPIEISNQNTATIRNIVAQPPYMALFTSYRVFDFRSVGNPWVFFVKIPANDYYGVNASGKQQINAPMCAYMDNDEERTLRFYNVFALMSFNLGTGIFSGSNSSLSSYNILEYIEVESDKALSGFCLINPRTGAVTHQKLDNSQNIISAGAAETSYIRRLVVNESLTAGGKTYYLPIPPVSDARFTVTLGLKSSNGDHVRITKKSTISNTVEGNTIIPALTSATFASGTTKSQGVLSGVFSVSNSKKVRFAQGNFLCDGRNSWTLEHEQYGVSYTNYSGSGYLWGCSHFGWCYDVDYAGGMLDGGDWGNHTQTSIPNRVDDYSIGPWWYEAFREGEYYWDNDDDCGYVYSQNPYAYQSFTVLTHDEYAYLVNTNRSALNPCNSNWATVDGIPGLLLFPDDFDLPYGISMTVGSSLSLTLSQWEKVQAAGAVFLPAAGRREGNIHYTSYGSGFAGFYWTSDRTSNNGTAFMFYPTAYGIDRGFGNWPICTGCSVRFVKVN